MDSWEKVFREGIAPLFTNSELATLREALGRDDPDLIQGATTRPPPLQCVQDWPVEAACALGYLGWKGRGKQTVGDVDEEFAKACFEADQRLGEPAAVRWFLNWFDETPREEMRQEMLRVLDDLLK